jgi:hypothetical protein
VPDIEKAIIKRDWNQEGPWEFLSRYLTVSSIREFKWGLSVK